MKKDDEILRLSAARLLKQFAPPPVTKCCRQIASTLRQSSCQCWWLYRQWGCSLHRDTSSNWFQSIRLQRGSQFICLSMIFWLLLILATAHTHICPLNAFHRKCITLRTIDLFTTFWSLNSWCSCSALAPFVALLSPLSAANRLIIEASAKEDDEASSMKASCVCVLSLWPLPLTNGHYERLAQSRASGAITHTSSSLATGQNQGEAQCWSTSPTFPTLQEPLHAQMSPFLQLLASFSTLLILSITD